MKKSKDKARKIALNILIELDNAKKPLDTIIDEVFAGNRHSKLDKAFIFSLVYGVLRWRNHLDWIIRHFSHVKTDKIDPEIYNILRLGLFQIIFLTRVPVSAAVNTSVDLAKTFADAWVVKYVNALLRKASVEYSHVEFPDFHKTPLLYISMKYSFPKWLVQRWIQRFGSHETKQLCKALNTIPPITVRANRIKTERDDLMRMLNDEAENVHPTMYSPDGLSFSNPKLPIEKLTTYKMGWFQVQDEAAQLIGLFLNPQPQEIILDACAGLGGKTGHIAQLMGNKGRIIAMDQDRNKLSRLRSGMMHLGVSIVTTNMHDLKEPFENKSSRMFDRILLDAPCSGLGVLRRNPDAKWALSKKNFQYYNTRQVTFLKNLASVVKLGGTLVYAVCSMEPEENEHVINAFLKARTDFAVNKERSDLHKGLRLFVDGDGFFRTLTYSSNMDGFFSVRLKRVK